MTLDPARTLPYCPVDHKVAAENDGGGNEDCRNAEKNDVGFVFQAPNAGAVCKQHVVVYLSPSVELRGVYSN